MNKKEQLRIAEELRTQERHDDYSRLRASRFVQYVQWSLHHGKDYLPWEEWKQAWNAGVIR